MQVTGPRADRIRFEGFELDLRTGELRPDTGKIIRLPEQSFQILTMLLESAGEVVSREQIRKRLWPNDTIVEFEHSISAAMRRVREALNDSCPLLHLAEQQTPSVTRDRSTVKPAHDLALIQEMKFEGFLITLCLQKAVLLLWRKFFSPKHLCHEVTAFFNFSVRNPG